MQQVGDIAVTDLEGLLAIRDLLQSSAAFAVVAIGKVRPRALGGTGTTPTAWIQPVSWSEGHERTNAHSFAEAGELPDRLRRVYFAIHLAVRGGNGDVEDLEQVDLLSQICADAIAGQALGECLPALTSVESGEWVGQFPETCLTLKGSFSYFPDADG